MLNKTACATLAWEYMFGLKCWDVVNGEFVGDCQILDKLIKELFADGFSEKRSCGWHSPPGQDTRLHSHSISEGTNTDCISVLQ